MGGLFSAGNPYGKVTGLVEVVGSKVTTSAYPGRSFTPYAENLSTRKVELIDGAEAKKWANVYNCGALHCTEYATRNGQEAIIFRAGVRKP